MDHVRGAPHHPQILGKIERWHQMLKNRTLLENYYLPRDLEKQIGSFLDQDNNRRYHESLSRSPRPRRTLAGTPPSSKEEKSKK